MSLINKLQYVSNLYKYDLNKCYIKPTKPYLALCGNIGDASTKEFTSFIDKTCQDFEKVLFVPGAKEYINMPKVEADLYFNSLEKHNTNFEFMDNKVINIDDSIIIGCVMWPNVSNMSCLFDDSMMNIKLDTTQYITPKKLKTMHIECRNFITETLSNIKNKNTNSECIIMSYFCPSYKMNSDNQHMYIPKMVKNNYASDLEDLLRAPLSVWITGVIDDIIEYEINNVKLLSNNKP
jgi:hypothetical protein